MDTSVTVIAISSAELILETDAANALGRLIGGSLLGFPLVQQFNTFPEGHMSVCGAP
jgi:hypothetical protein